MKKTLFSFIAVLFIFTPTKAQIVINEVHYNPATSQGSDYHYEFVELFNAGQSDVDLTGYVFMLEDDDRTYQKKTTLGSLTIAAGSYAIISTDTSDEAGYTAYKNLSVPVYRLNEGKAGSAAHTMLINAGGQISLLMGNGITFIDNVDYYSHTYVSGGNDDASNGGGKSDELKDFASDNWGAGTGRDEWGPSTADNGTPGAQNSIFNGTAWNSPPTAFEWVSSALDTIYFVQSNLDEIYTLQWTASTDAGGDSINYIVYAKIGVYPAQAIYDTSSISVPITYREILEGVFEELSGNSATIKLTVYAHDGTDSTKVTGDDRVLYVNRYYLSTQVEGVPVKFALHENYPNPFNPTTTLRFDLPEVSNLTLTIYNMLGQKVRTFNYQNTSAGYHSVKWNATNDYGNPVGAGVYLYQLQTKDFVKTRKMVLLK